MQISVLCLLQFKLRNEHCWHSFVPICYYITTLLQPQKIRRSPRTSTQLHSHLEEASGVYSNPTEVRLSPRLLDLYLHHKRLQPQRSTWVNTVFSLLHQPHMVRLERSSWHSSNPLMSTLKVRQCFFFHFRGVLVETPQFVAGYSLLHVRCSLPLREQLWSMISGTTSDKVLCPNHCWCSTYHAAVAVYATFLSGAKSDSVVALWRQVVAFVQGSTLLAIRSRGRACSPYNQRTTRSEGLRPGGWHV